MIFNPAHPGEVLRDDLGDVTVSEAALRLGVPRAHLSRFLNAYAGVTARIALRLAAAFGTSREFWLKMQLNHDLWQEKQKADQFKVVPFPHTSNIEKLMAS